MCSDETRDHAEVANLPGTVHSSAFGVPGFCAFLAKLKSTTANVAGESERDPTRESLFETFWAHVDRRGDNECWPWFAYRHSKGYGRSFVRVDGQVYVVPHRASWAIHYGAPGHLHVLHRCDNPPCVNPRHLFLGTNLDNVKDRVAKGRTQKGARHFKSHLTDDDVRAIRASSDSKAELARRYNVTAATIRAILLRVTWKHLP